jgi:hypothetical protein
VSAAIAFNLTRAAECPGIGLSRQGQCATIRRQLIAVPGRLARSRSDWLSTYPRTGPWQESWEALFNGGPPTTNPSNDLTTQTRQGPTKDTSGKAGQTGGYLTPYGEGRTRNRPD